MVLRGNWTNSQKRISVKNNKLQKLHADQEVSELKTLGSWNLLGEDIVYACPVHTLPSMTA